MIQQYVRGCEVCQRCKYETLSPAGLLQPLPIPTATCIGGLPKSQGLDTIMVVVDRLSKYAHFIPLTHPYSTKEVAEVFLKEVVRLHGFPTSTVSDKDRVFISSFWSELFKLSGTKLKFSSAYHPQTDGQTEVVNRCLETYLRCFTSNKPRQWNKWLSWAEFWFNTSYNASSKATPFKILYGRDPPVLIRGDVHPTSNPEVNQMLEDRNQMIDVLKEQLCLAQNRMKVQADKHRREVEYQVGDMVFLKIQPYRFKNLTKRSNQKLSPRFYGPYEVIAKVGAAAYRLRLPDTSRVHPVFHVSLLKRCVAPGTFSQPLPLCLNEEWELQQEPEDIMAIRINEQGRHELLVKWKNLPSFENSWESKSVFMQQYPTFQLEDKLSLLGGSIDKAQNDRPQITNVYVRKRGVLGPKPNEGSMRGGSSAVGGDCN